MLVSVRTKVLGFLGLLFETNGCRTGLCELGFLGLFQAVRGGKRVVQWWGFGSLVGFWWPRVV